jgi:hypothetical protein
MGGSVRNVLVFGGANALDFADVRLSVLRIPEVSLKIEEAQEIWDKCCGSSFSFHHFLASDDQIFFKNLGLKTLALAVVQLGLYDRYKRIFSEPKILIGNVKNDSALMVASGLMSFEELITSSRACHMVRPMAHLQSVENIMLNGPILPQYQAFIKTTGADAATASATTIGEPDMDLRKVLERVVDEQRVERIIHVGPGLIDRALIMDLEPRELQIVESIDIDPMLNWFWRDLHQVTNRALALA